MVEGLREASKLDTFDCFISIEAISAEGEKSNVHYVRDGDGNTMGFKFKNHSADYIHNYEKNREAGTR